MRYLGIDYGSKKVGLAISDEEGFLAFPYRKIQNNLELIDEIHNICGGENINFIVIGESFDLKGQPNKIMNQIEKFIEILKKETDLPIFLEKEFLTTVGARGFGNKESNNARKIKKIKKKELDSSAAALILQRFLDRKNQINKI